MDCKAVLLLVFLASGAIVGVCPQDDGSGTPSTTERQDPLDQPHHQHHFNPSSRQQQTLHQRPTIAMTPHHQVGMHQPFPRYTPSQRGYSSGLGINPYAVNGVASWRGHPSSMDSTHPASLPRYGHQPIYFHPQGVPVRQYATKVFRTHRRGSAVIPYEGAAVRVPATWGQRKVDTSSSEGLNDESSCVKCPRKRVILVAGRGETKVALKLPETHRRCPGRKVLRGKRRRALTRHGRFRGTQDDEHRSTEDNLTFEDDENVRLEALWGPELGTMLKEGRHVTVFSLLRNNKALRTCHVTMIVKVQKCSPLLLPPNTRARCSQGTVWGSRCEFSCIQKSTQTTFVPTDVKETTCEMMTVKGEMGWSHEPPECTEDSMPPTPAAEASDIEVSDESCAMPFPPAEGTISCGDDNDSSHKESVPVGTVCRYKCSDGYHIPPPQRHLATTKCLSGGDWSTAADPYCERIVDNVKDTMVQNTSILSKHSRVGR